DPLMALEVSELSRQISGFSGSSRSNGGQNPLDLRQWRVQASAKIRYDSPSMAQLAEKQSLQSK
ncbi:Hypothetical protein FKW44_005524, partial [Caligus rogercresseyi]